MNVLELKGDIVVKLGQVQNQAVLESVRKRLAREVKKESIEHDWWDDLTPEQQADLAEGIREMDDPSKWVSHEEAMKLFSKYLAT